MSGKKIPDIYDSILKLVETNLAYNIKIKSPKIDIEMVKEIKDMRVHLYPSHKYEVSAFFLIRNSGIRYACSNKTIRGSYRKNI